MNHFKVKTWGGFNLVIPEVKKIHSKRIEVFTIRLSPKSIATSNSNLLTRPHTSFEFTNPFSSWIYSNTSTHACDFEIPLKGFRSPSVVDLITTTTTTLALEILQGILSVEDFREFWVQKP